MQQLYKNDLQQWEIMNIDCYFNHSHTKLNYEFWKIKNFLYLMQVIH